MRKWTTLPDAAVFDTWKGILSIYNKNLKCYGIYMQNEKILTISVKKKVIRMEKVKILLIGVGGYGSNYIKELTEKNVTSAEIAGICEVMPDAETVYPVIKDRKISLYGTPEEFYRERKADLAVISTPIHLHYEQIITCLENGSDVLTEKPVCTSTEEAERLMEAERASGHFVAVGYQLNYSRDVLVMKQDILKGVFGKPVSMKALHAMARGKQYYTRNRWAGKIEVNGYKVNDSPFNNACAHQFQNMTFLLGDQLNRAAGISHAEAELYRANADLENFDTAAVRAWTEAGIPICYYTTHALEEKKLGPISEYRFEHAVIYYGKDYGNGPVMEYVVEREDGSRMSYGEIPKGERLQKLYDAIEGTKSHTPPVCTIQCAMPHLTVVNQLEQMPFYQVREEELEHVETDGDQFCRIRGLGKIFHTCYENNQMPSEVGAHWKKEKER